MSSIPQNVSESVRKINPHLYDAVPPGKVAPPVVAGKRIRQDPKPIMNKLETDWFKMLCLQFPEKAITIQALKFRLGNGIFYKPDFVVFSSVLIYAYEVKGPHAFRGGFENLKVAAGMYPAIYWTLIWKEDGQWKEQVVKP